MLSQEELRNFTLIPRTLHAQRQKAEGYIQQFSDRAPFIADDNNPYLRWLGEKEKIDREFFFEFVNWWFWLSRFQPQTLWRLMSIFPDQEDQAEIFPNAIEESGLRKKLHQPHWWHLERLVESLGGSLKPDRESEAMLQEFMRLLDSASEAQAIGYLGAIEYPGLVISKFFTTLMTKLGRSDLVKDDFYCRVHSRVEFSHVVKSVGSMLVWINDKERQRNKGYEPMDVVYAFENGMRWWEAFWSQGFRKLGYRR
ncbi:MAG: hypothetical protein IPG22_13850 [Acidobacteria bacterium]|nr:hypothetical protein [Acidobacteriota bacterium]